MSRIPNDNPWQRPPFWADGPTEWDLDRRRCKELQRARSRLLFLEPGTARWRGVRDRVARLEIALGLSPTLPGRAIIYVPPTVVREVPDGEDDDEG